MHGSPRLRHRGWNGILGGCRIQRKYLRLYRQRLDPDFPILSEELQGAYKDRPWRFPFEAPGLFGKRRLVGASPHPDPEFEHARLRWRRRRRVVLAVLLLGWIIPIVLSTARL